jgi:hypothetical protein
MVGVTSSVFKWTDQSLGTPVGVFATIGETADRHAGQGENLHGNTVSKLQTSW